MFTFILGIAFAFAVMVYVDRQQEKYRAASRAASEEAVMQKYLKRYGALCCPIHGDGKGINEDAHI
jgi:hypothetical protein